MTRRNLFRVVRHDLTGYALNRGAPEFRPTPCYWLECEGQRINPCAMRGKAEEICKALNAAARRWARGQG